MKEPQDVREYTIEKLADAWETESVKEGIDAFFSKRRDCMESIIKQKDNVENV